MLGLAVASVGRMASKPTFRGPSLSSSSGICCYLGYVPFVASLSNWAVTGGSVELVFLKKKRSFVW
jgi:hypothetical protein